MVDILYNGGVFTVTEGIPQPSYTDSGAISGEFVFGGTRNKG